MGRKQRWIVDVKVQPGPEGTVLRSGRSREKGVEEACWKCYHKANASKNVIVH